MTLADLNTVEQSSSRSCARIWSTTSRQSTVYVAKWRSSGGSTTLVIVRGFHATTNGDRPYLALERLAGPRLSTLLRKHGALPLDQLLPLGMETRDASVMTAPALLPNDPEMRLS